MDIYSHLSTSVYYGLFSRFIARKDKKSSYSGGCSWVVLAFRALVSHPAWHIHLSLYVDHISRCLKDGFQ